MTLSRAAGEWPTRNHMRFAVSVNAPRGTPVLAAEKLPAGFNPDSVRVMGPGSRNLDGIEHVSVDYAEGSSSDLATLGFEDLFGGGDFDYNDAMFKLEGGIGLARVPEPASLILLVLGLAAAAPLLRSLSGVRRREDAGSPLE